MGGSLPLLLTWPCHLGHMVLAFLVLIIASSGLMTMDIGLNVIQCPHLYGKDDRGTFLTQHDPVLDSF